MNKQQVNTIQLAQVKARDHIEREIVDPSDAVAIRLLIHIAELYLRIEGVLESTGKVP